MNLYVLCQIRRHQIQITHGIYNLYKQIHLSLYMFYITYNYMYVESIQTVNIARAYYMIDMFDHVDVL